MRNLYLHFTLILIILLDSHSFCQQGWFPQNSGTTVGLTSVSFVDANNGWIVGSDGTILKTTDGGDNWISQPSGTTNILEGVSFIDKNKGWAVGHGGTILFTNDGGNNWIQQNSGITSDLYAVCFTDSNYGTTVCYGTILRTSNGGKNWVISLGPGACMSLWSVFFVDSLYGFAGGQAGFLWKTTDGGLNWNYVNSWQIYNDCHSICFVNSNVGYCAGEIDIGNHYFPTIWKTTNGGNSWIIKWHSSDEGGSRGIFFTDPDTGYAFGHGILKSTDGGDNWIIQSPYSGSDIIFTDANTGTAVGGSGTILRTTDSGVTFIQSGNSHDNISNYFLFQNYPNPFNPSTVIKYSIPRISRIIIRIFDVLGKEIEILIDEEKPSGIYEVNWSAEKHSSGIYFCKMQAGSYAEIRKMLLIK